MFAKGKLSFMSILKEVEGRIMADNKKGKMIAFFTPLEYDFSSIPGEDVPAEDRHITLGLLHGDEQEDRKLQPVLKDLAAQMKPIGVSLDKLGVFPPNEHNHGKFVLHAEPDSESLQQIHDFIFAALEKHKIPVDNGSFSFKPHITLKYCDEDPTEFIKSMTPKDEIKIENLSLASGGKKYHFRMGGN